VQIGTQRAREELGARIAKRRVGVAETARDHPAGAARRLTTAARSRSATLTSTMTLPSASGMSAQPVDQGDSRVTRAEMWECASVTRVVLTGRRLGAGDGAEQIEPRTVPLDRRAADRHHRGAALDGRAHRGEDCKGWAGCGPSTTIASHSETSGSGLRTRRIAARQLSS